MTKDELTPIDPSKYKITETGQVLKMTKDEMKDEMKDKISMALKDTVLQQGFEIICKENAELKAFKQDCIKLTEDNIVMAKQREEIAIQLTKAKELLTKWVELFKPKGGNIPPTPIQVETEQFIREVTV